MQDLKENRTLNDAGQVIVQRSYTLPRYSASIHNGCDWACDDVICDLKASAVIYAGARDFSILTNVDHPYEVDDFLTGNLEKDLAAFQNYLDQVHGRGKYEAFVLGAYVHSGASFSISKEGDRRCRWDSSQLGFIGLPVKDGAYSASDPDAAARDLTAAWNGEFTEYAVVDNLTDDIEDCVCTADYKEASDFCKMAKEKYGVDFDGVDPVY